MIRICVGNQNSDMRQSDTANDLSLTKNWRLIDEDRHQTFCEHQLRVLTSNYSDSHMK